MGHVQRLGQHSDARKSLQRSGRARSRLRAGAARLSSTLRTATRISSLTKAVERRARAEAEEALRLQPNLGEGYAARALCLYWTERNYEAALRELERAAARLLPNSAEVARIAAFIRRRQGRWKEARAGLNEPGDADPRDSIILGGLFATDYYLRDWTAAKQTSEAAFAAATGPADASAHREDLPGALER